MWMNRAVIFVEGVRAALAFHYHLRTGNALRPLAVRLGVPLAELALPGTIQQEDVTGPLVGSPSPTRMREHLVAPTVTLSPEDLAQIDDILAESW